MVSVFIVDDEESIRDLFSLLLRIKGFEVIGAAKDGAEALRLYKNFIKKPDIILMDHRMANKNGMDTTREILQIGKESKIIFISADTSVKNEAFSIGVKSFKIKPFSIDLLIENIKKALSPN